MQKIEVFRVFNDKKTIQFPLEQEAEAFKFSEDNNLNIERIEVEIVPSQITPSSADWYDFEQTLYENPSILQKALTSQGNGFAFLLKVLTDGRTIHATQFALKMGIELTMMGMKTPLTQEEIDFINENLIKYNFSIQI